MNRSRDIAAVPPAAPPRAAALPRGHADAELRAFHAALLALPVPERLVRLVLGTDAVSSRADIPADREDRR